MYVLSTKVPIRKKSGNLFNDPRIYIYIYMCVCVCVCVCVFVYIHIYIYIYVCVCVYYVTVSQRHFNLPST